MADAASADGERDARGDWRPARPITLPPFIAWPPPPLVTCRFFGLAPLSSTRSRVWRAIDDQEVKGPLTACGEPSTWGRKVSAAPKL